MCVLVVGALVRPFPRWGADQLILRGSLISAAISGSSLSAPQLEVATLGDKLGTRHACSHLTQTGYFPLLARGQVLIVAIPKPGLRTNPGNAYVGRYASVPNSQPVTLFRFI